MTQLSDTRMLASADGTEIYANAVGDHTKQAIVFIHGFAWSLMAFDSIFRDPRWLDRLYLVRYDARGHGRSGKPPDFDEAWESKRFAEDFDTVVEAYKLRKPFVAGWSLGASHLIDILSFHAVDYVAGIINIAGAAYLTEEILQDLVRPHMWRVLNGMMDSPDVDDYRMAVIHFLECCCPNLPYEYRRSYLGNVMAQPRCCMKRSLTRKQRRETFDEVGKTKLPCLVIYGDQDVTVSGDRLPGYYENWKKVTVEVVEGGSHMPWSETTGHSDVFREKVLGWVGSVMDPEI